MCLSKVWNIVSWWEPSRTYMWKKKKFQSVLVDCQRGIGETLRVKPLTWGHRPNFGSPGIWVVTYLASNYLVQICGHFLLLSASNSNIHAKLIKPDTMIFNIVLDGCVGCGSSFKGQQIIELMPQVGFGLLKLDIRAVKGLNPNIRLASTWKPFQIPKKWTSMLGSGSWIW